MAILKHIASKSSNYGAALEYLIFKHDELRKAPILDQNGNRIMRDEFYLDGLNALEQIYNIIDSRYRSRKPLIVTTNLTLTELKNPQDTAHARIYDRLLELCTPIACTGPSMRKNIGQGKLDFLKTLLV